MHDRLSFGGGVTKDTLVLGVSPDYQHIRNLIVTVGRFFDETDDAADIKVRRSHGTVCPGRATAATMQPWARAFKSRAFRSPSSASSRRR